ncbi:MAG TPA: protein kinase, partial [Pseudomonadota bacterium]|nr:protein kinase [Pseudomonadota bacterium]
MHPESTPTWLVGPETPPTERIGTILSGSYRLDAFLGQGMTGTTYNAWHLRQKQPYAVKLIHRGLAPSHERVLKLRQDLRTLSGLRQFGFLPVELSFAPDGAPFLAAELLIGETLRSRLSRGPLPSLASGIVVNAIARALGEAHKVGVVHGDLRPENILLPSENGREVEAGQPVLVDAALHHLRKRPIGIDESLPLSKLVYLAPEQASGEQGVADQMGDIFALGAMLYECVTGQQAFSGTELEDVLEKLAAPPKKLQLPREVGAPPGLAEGLDEVIAKACARSPEERYATMADLMTALSAVYEKVGLPLPPPDERVPVETVKAQNRELRRRTVAVKRVMPLAPMAELPETSGVMSAAAFAHLNAIMAGASEDEAAESKPAAAPEPKSDAKAADKPERKRNTAKHRTIKRTVRAKDLSKILAEIEAGRLDPEQAMALAAATPDEEFTADDDDSAGAAADDDRTEAQKIIDEGRAAVLARAEAAKKNRDADAQRLKAREQADAKEMQKRLLEQARAETLGRMRAEWELSRPVAKLSAKDLQDGGKSEKGATPVPGGEVAQQAELLAEARRQSSRLEEERKAAEQKAAEQAESARKEASAAEKARAEAEKLSVALRQAEQKEAERAEAVRLQGEREAEARKRVEEAAAQKQAKLAEAELAQRAAEEARRQAELALEQAEAAKQAAESETEAASWEDGLALLLEEPTVEMQMDSAKTPDGKGKKTEHKAPPPMPAAALGNKTETARRAEELARKAQAEARAAAEAAEQARQAAAAIERTAELAQQE